MSIFDPRHIRVARAFVPAKSPPTSPIWRGSRCSADLDGFVPESESRVETKTRTGMSAPHTWHARLPAKSPPTLLIGEFPMFS